MAWTQEAKRLELQQRLAQLQQQLVEEHNAALIKEAEKWDADRAQVEDVLRASLRVPAEASGSDSDQDPDVPAPGTPAIPRGVQGNALFWLRTMSSQFKDVTNRFRKTTLQLGKSSKEILVLRRQVNEQSKELSSLRLQLDDASNAAARADHDAQSGRGAGGGASCSRCRVLQAANKQLLDKVAMLENQVALMSAGSVAGDGASTAIESSFL